MEGDTVSLEVVLGYPAKRQFEAIRPHSPRRCARSRRAERACRGVAEIAAHAVQRGVKLLPNVKNIVAVASGKAASARARPP